MLSNLTRPYSVEKSPYSPPLLFKEAPRVKSALKKGDTYLWRANQKTTIY